MRAEIRATARRQIDKRLNILADPDALARPSQGWIKAIREALGMTTGQLARRLGLSQPRAYAIEKAEASGAITLATLERAAQALDCRLVYALVPRKPLDALVEERSRLVARRRLEAARHTMVLESQGVHPADEKEQVERLVRRLAERGGSKLWDDET